MGLGRANGQPSGRIVHQKMFFDVLAVPPLITGQTEQAFLENGFLELWPSTCLIRQRAVSSQIHFGVGPNDEEGCCY
jgi:hypothetical protein